MAEEKKILKKFKAEKKLLKLIKAKSKKHFRGSFGSKSIRKKSIRKWDKWRHARGIDATIRLDKREDGVRPKAGHRTNRLIRGLHASGFEETLVNNANEINETLRGRAIKISSTVGMKKRKLMIEKADKLEIKILNRGL